MFSLDWVKNKAQVMGSAHLINDYLEHGDALDKEVCLISLYSISISLHFTRRNFISLRFTRGPGAKLLSEPLKS